MCYCRETLQYAIAPVVVVSGVIKESSGFPAKGGKLTALYPIVPNIAVRALYAWWAFRRLSDSCATGRFCPDKPAGCSWHGFCLVLPLEVWFQVKEEI
jgi:hypothetical protein